MAFESARASVVYIMCTLMGMYAKTQQNYLKDYDAYVASRYTVIDLCAAAQYPISPLY